MVRPAPAVDQRPLGERAAARPLVGQREQLLAETTKVVLAARAAAQHVYPLKVPVLQTLTNGPMARIWPR